MEYPKECCGGKCLFRCYPVAKAMMCPNAIEADIEQAKEILANRESHSEGPLT